MPQEIRPHSIPSPPPDEESPMDFSPRAVPAVISLWSHWIIAAHYWDLSKSCDHIIMTS